MSVLVFWAVVGLSLVLGFTIYRKIPQMHLAMCVLIACLGLLLFLAGFVEMDGKVLGITLGPIKTFATSK
jgi:hypothetical protein